MKIEGVKRATKREREMRWLGNNREFLQHHYAGKWVAIQDDKLVGSGPTFGEAVASAKAAGVTDPVIAPVRAVLSLLESDG